MNEFRTNDCIVHCDALQRPCVHFITTEYRIRNNEKPQMYRYELKSILKVLYFTVEEWREIEIGIEVVHRELLWLATGVLLFIV